MNRPVNSVGNEHSLAQLVEPRRQKVKPSEYPGLTYIGLEHIESHSSRVIGAGRASEMRSTAHYFKPGDVLYSRLRPYLNKVWTADREGLCSAEFIVLPRNDRIEADFLRYRLNAPDFVSFANRLNAGDRPRVDFDQISTFRTWLPETLAEQRRIVAEIEKQFTRLDAAVASLARVLVNLRRYRATVLKTACEGRLVTGDKAQWRRGTLGDVLLQIDAGKSFRCEERPPQAAEVGIIKVSAVTWGTYAESESKTCQDPARVDLRYFIERGDFLFSRANTIDLVGACVIAETVNLRVMLSDKILRFRFTPDVDPRWVLHWLRSEDGRREIERLATGNQESMRNIGQDRIRQIMIALPPLSEQNRIVAEVERRLSVIEELERVVEASLQRAKRLREVILDRAFSGNL